MSKKTVTDALVAEMAEAGVKRLYGLVGGSLNPVSDSLRRDARITFIRVRHKETAGSAIGMSKLALMGHVDATADFFTSNIRSL